MTFRRAIVACSLAVSFCVDPAYACINTFKSDIVGSLRNGGRDQAVRYVERLEATARKDPTLENLNDAAVGRLLIGDMPTAIEQLQSVEKKFPGKAVVAANLGTAYELSGDLDEGLRWIAEGVKRDPKEHQGSEWLHVEILKARQALTQDPKWLGAHSVLGLDTGEGDHPTMPPSLPLDHTGKPRTLQDIERAISYQLDERTNFVIAPDGIVADLYGTGGDLLWLIGKPSAWKTFQGHPDSAYEFALEWGSPREELVRARLAAFKVDYPRYDDWAPNADSTLVSTVQAPQANKLAPEPKSIWTPWRIALLGLVGILAIGTIATYLRTRKP